MEFPSDYPISDGVMWSGFSFCVNCTVGYSRAKIVNMRTWWSLSANTVSWGWFYTSTPLYRSLSGGSVTTIKTLIYKDFKLLKVTYMNLTQPFV